MDVGEKILLVIIATTTAIVLTVVIAVQILNWRHRRRARRTHDRINRLP